MTPENGNDCVEALLFPRRPSNRPGLSRIDYRIGVYWDFREALLRDLNKDPILASWSHREPDDPGIALLEGAAILGDILTFYQELYANEAFLRTAQWRESIAELVRLLGYRLSPGVGGRGDFAFEIGGDSPVPIPKGFPITAQLTGQEEQADFETTEEAVAYPWLSAFKLFRPLEPRDVSSQTEELYITSLDPVTSPFQLEKGDRLLVGDPYALGDPARTRLLNGEIVIVDDVRERHGQKLYRIKGALTRTTGTDKLVAYKIGRSFRHFGHNAPPTRTVVTTVSGNTSVTQPEIIYERYLDGATTTDVKPMLAKLEFPLAAEVDDLARGATLLCQSILDRSTGDPSAVEFTLIRKIDDLRPASYSWGSMTGPSTLLILDDKLMTTTDPAVDGGSSATTFDRLDIRQIQFHETLSPMLRLSARDEPTAAVSGHDLAFLGTDAQVQRLKDRRLLFVKEGSDPRLATVQSVETLEADVAKRSLLRRVTLDKRQSYAEFPNEDATVTVYGNLVQATQGKKEREAVLGNGDSRQSFQTFKLPKAPLTYLIVAGETPPEVPELQVYVNDRLWKQVPSLFNRGPEEEVYIVREDANGDSWIQCGDGKTGARLPSGLRNMVARYRSGIGAYGALKEGTSAQGGSRLDHLDKVRLPGVVSGGGEPESGGNARLAAPGKIQSLDRLVSLRDFETETLAIAGVSRARARWELKENVPTVEVTVLMKTGREAELAQLEELLAKYNRSRGPQRFPVIVQRGSLQYLFLDATLAVDPALREELVMTAAKQALGVTGGTEASGTVSSAGLLAVDQRQFGEREYTSRIEGTLQNVPGVLWARVEGLGSLGPASDPTTMVPPDSPGPPEASVDCDADKILSLHIAHLKLRPTAAQTES